MPVRPAAFALSLVLASCAVAQSDEPAIFIANNGNLEGSVTSMKVNPDGTLTFVDRHITGSRPNTTVIEPGCNAYAVTLSPNGKHLVSSHAASNAALQQLSLFRVNSDATIDFVAAFMTPSSPLAVKWVTDEYLAVTRTGSASNGVYMYRFDPDAPGGPTLTSIDIKVFGSFTSYLAVHPSREYLYASNSLGGSSLFVFRVNANGTLTFVEEFVTPALPLGPGISPDGRLLYAGGGISAGGKAVVGMTIASDGTLASLPDSPWQSPGSSPKQVVVSRDNTFAAAAHGSDSSIRIFTIDDVDGGLTYTGGTASIGIQGSLGEIEFMGDYLFACDRDTINDGVRGVRAYTVTPAGLLVANGSIVDTQGIAPNGIAVWTPPCPGDTNGDGVVDFTDFSAVLGQYGQAGPGLSGDLNGDGVVDFTDFSIVLANYGTSC